MSNNSKYEGNFEKGLFNGFGKYFFSDGKIYEGNWKDDLMDGEGIIVFPQGHKLQAVF